MGLIVIEVNLQVLDRDTLIKIGTFPHIGDGTNDDWFIANLGDYIGYEVRGR